MPSEMLPATIQKVHRDVASWFSMVLLLLCVAPACMGGLQEQLWAATASQQQLLPGHINGVSGTTLKILSNHGCCIITVSTIMFCKCSSGTPVHVQQNCQHQRGLS